MNWFAPGSRQELFFGTGRENEMKTHLEILNDQYSIWIGHDEHHHEYVVEGFRKVDGGVKHLVTRYKQVRLELISHDLEQHGVFSKRPFELGQGCDVSSAACCFALFHHFCLSQGLDSVALHRKAYFEDDRQRYQQFNPEANQKFADWQGVAYPDQWTNQAYQGLIKLLLGINNRSLVQVLEEAVETSTLLLEHQIRAQIKQLSFLD